MDEHAAAAGMEPDAWNIVTAGKIYVWNFWKE